MTILKKTLFMAIVSGSAAVATTPFLYDIDKTYDENCEAGPAYPGNYPIRDLPKQDKWYDFLGVPIASPLGIPAGPLLNSKYTQEAFDSGADIVIYKTIRTTERAVNGFPNVRYLQVSGMFDPRNPPKILLTRETMPENPDEIAITNSFGMPSKGADYLEEDIHKAAHQAREGQVFVVSVVGTNKQDFVQAALNAKQWGAQVVEVNFSCPNVTTKEGQLYLDPEGVFDISKEIVHALEETPLIIKVGKFESKEQLAKTLIAAEQAGVKAVSGINTVSVEVRTPDGRPALDANRLKSGVCGSPIRATALQFAKDAREVITENDLKLTLIAGGGVTKPEHFDEFLLYADFVMCATGWLRDPYIMTKWHESQR